MTFLFSNSRELPLVANLEPHRFRAPELGQQLQRGRHKQIDLHALQRVGAGKQLRLNLHFLQQFLQAAGAGQQNVVLHARQHPAFILVP